MIAHASAPPYWLTTQRTSLALFPPSEANLVYSRFKA